MSEIDSVYREINATIREHNRPNIVRARVTTFAPAGQILVVPVHPDRARAEGLVPLRALEDGTVDVFPIVESPTWPREILIHPKDWAHIRLDAGARDAVGFDPVAIFGFPVVNDARPAA